MTQTLESVRMQVRESVDAKTRLLRDENALALIARAAEIITEAYQKGHKTLFAGNGGSAADAQHMAGEMVSKFRFDRPGIPSVALTTDSSIMTAIGNDYGYDILFSRQIEAQGSRGDVFIGISTSGNSRNLVRARQACAEKGIFCIALVGANPCSMDDYDLVIHIPSTETPRIQECQTLIGHIICCIVEEKLFAKEYRRQ